MKRLLRSVLLALAASAALVTSSLATVTTDPAKTGIGLVRDLGTYTYATLPAASSANQNKTAFVTDLGTNGTLLTSNGTRWRALNGEANLAQLGAPVSGIANSETIVLQTLIPAGAWQANDTIRIWLNVSKTGTTDGLNVSVRIGTAGTTADTAVTGLSAAGLLVAANVDGGFVVDVKQLSATSVLRVGSAAGNAGSYTGPTATAVPAATTVTSAAANALWVTVTLASTGATNTGSLQSGHIQLITP